MGQVYPWTKDRTVGNKGVGLLELNVGVPVHLVADTSLRTSLGLDLPPALLIAGLLVGGLTIQHLASTDQTLQLRTWNQQGVTVQSWPIMNLYIITSLLYSRSKPLGPCHTEGPTCWLTEIILKNLWKYHKISIAIKKKIVRGLWHWKGFCEC